MSRTVRLLLWLVATAAISVIALWHLAFRVSVDLPGEVRVSGLSAPVRLSWIDDLDAEARVGRREDVPRVVGVVHALSRPWTLLLVRQAALGRLSEWYGEETLPLDRHARLAGFAPDARAAFDALPAPAQAVYQAYASGVNATLRLDRVQFAAGLSALGVEPEPWQAWHSMAVERMVGWLAAVVEEDTLALDRLLGGIRSERDSLVAAARADSAEAALRLDSLLAADPLSPATFAFADSLALVVPPDSIELPEWPDTTADGRPTFLAQAAVRRFLADRDSLGAFLALSGLEHGAAWSLGSPADGVFVRYVWGSAAEPPVVAIRLTGPAVESDLVTWLGTPAPLAWRDRQGAVASVPGTRLRIGFEDTGESRSWESIRVRGVGTDVVERRGGPASLALGERAETLVAAFLDAGRDDPVTDGPVGPVPTLGSAALRLGTAGPARAEGVAPVEAPGVRLVSLAPERYELADVLSELRAGSRRVFDERRSAWAAGRVLRLLGTLAGPPTAVDSSVVADSTATDSTLVDSTAVDTSAWPPRMDSLPPVPGFLPAAPDTDAVAYLRSWDARFDGSSIAATFFEPLAGDDSITTERLARIVDSLGGIHGPDRWTWRWERDTTAWMRLPGGPRSGVRSPLPSRYAPVPVPRSGHPTAPSWGSAPRWVRRSAPAAFEAWLPSEPGEPMLFRRPAVPFERFLGRFRPLPETAPVKRLAPAGAGRVTNLVPA